MKVRQLLFERWTGQPWNNATRLSESLKKLSARLGKSQMKRYCLGVIVKMQSDIVVAGVDATQDDMLLAMGNVNLSHHGGHLVENLPIRLVTVSNDIEGFLPDAKRDLIVPDAGYAIGAHTMQHSFVLAYADRFFGAGDVDALDRCQGAKPMSMMSGDAEFALQLNNLPANVTAPAGITVSVWLWVLETAAELVDRPTRIVQKTDLQDPIQLPYAFKKLAFLGLVTQPNNDNSLNGNVGVFPQLEVDGINQLEQLNMLEVEIGRRWIRSDGDKIGANGALAGTLLGRTTSILIDPYEAQKYTYFNSGHDWNIWGQLQAVQQAGAGGFLIALMRIFEDLPATDYAVQMSRDNIGNVERKDINVGGTPVRAHGFTRGELLGIQAQVRSRAAQRKRVEED